VESIPAPILRKEYDRIVKQLMAIYEASGPAKKKLIEAADNDFHAGDPDELISMVQRWIPGAFDRARLKPDIKWTPWPTIRAEEPPQRYVFHGTTKQRAEKIVYGNGFCAPPADYVTGGDDQYGWDGVWREEFWAIYKALPPGVKAKFHLMIGDKYTRGRNKRSVYGDTQPFGLLFTTMEASQRDGAWGHEIVFKIDMSRVNYCFWFSDEILGDKGRHIAFVVPLDCPQADPAALTIVKGEI
jgi:hypothetical protein